MKFASGLVLAAVAVTAANAGNPNYLRKTEDESSHHEADNSSMLLTRNPSSGKELTPDDLTIDLTEILGESTDSSHLKINILDLIGSGSDQVDLEDIIDAFKESAGSEDMDWLDEAGQEDEDGDHTHMKGEYKDNSFFNKGHHAGGADLSWLDDLNDESGSVDYDGEKSDAKKAFDPKDDDDSSSSDDLSWLDEDSVTGSADVDDVGGAKGDSKGTSEYGKGKGPVSGSVGMAWYYGNTGSDATGAKGANKGAASIVSGSDPVAEKGASKGAFAYGKGKEDDNDDMAWLFEDSGSDDVGAKDATKGTGLYDDDEPTASKSATKGAGFYDEDEEPVVSKSATKGAGIYDEDEEPVVSKSATKGAGIYDEDEEPDAEKNATKSSKSSKKGAAGSSPVPLYDDGSKGQIGGEGLDEDKNPFIIAGATKGEASNDADDNHKGSIPDEDSADEIVQSGDDVEDDNIATKGSKQALP